MTAWEAVIFCENEKWNLRTFNENKKIYTKYRLIKI